MKESLTFLTRQGLPEAKANYFVRHWRGDLTLGISYWVSGLLLYFLIVLCGQLLLVMKEPPSLKAGVAVSILLSALGLTARIWHIVGVWRSAKKHVERGGRSVWATLAKIAMIYGTLNLVHFTIKTTAPQSIDRVGIVLGDLRMPAYVIRVLPGGTEIEFHGGLRAGAAKELERIIKDVPQATVLHINSTGGRIHEGENMAKLVRDRGLTTYASEKCLSAATLVLIAGKERVVATEARVGFHRASLPGMTDAQRRNADELMRQTMRTAGISDEFIGQVLATGPRNMWYPSIEEMHRAGVITCEAFGERFTMSGMLLRDSSPENIDKAFRRLPGFSAIKEIEPVTYRKLTHEYAAAMQSGKSVDEAQNIVRGMADQLVLKYLPMASDEALRKMRDLWVNMLLRFKDKDSRACMAAISPKGASSDPNYARIFSGWSATNNLVVLDKVLRSAAKGTRPTLNIAQAEGDLRGIQSTLTRDFGDEFKLIGNEEEWMRNSKQTCDMLLAFYRETEKIPNERQGNLLRYLLAADDSKISSHTTLAMKTNDSLSENTSKDDYSNAAALYVVKSGDRLSQIANAHTTTIQAIQAANNMNTTKILVGQKLKIPNP